MFEELPTTLSTTLSVVSLLFFAAVYLTVCVRAFRYGADELDARARMALDAPPPSGGANAAGSAADVGAARDHAVRAR